METFVLDIRYALRAIVRTPAFAVVAILTIALGIGASATMFSVVNSVLLRPLPYAHSGRLTLIWADLRNRAVFDFPFSPGDFRDLQRNTTAFEDLGAVATGRTALIGSDGEGEQIRTAAITQNFFRLLGAGIQTGRDFTEEDARVQAQPQQRLPLVAIMSDGLWHRRFGGNPAVVGTTVELGNNRALVVGVLNPGLELLFPASANIEREPDLWTALRLDFDNSPRDNVFLRVVGRLKPDASVASAQQQAETVAADLRKRFPTKQTAGLHFRVVPMREDLVKESRPVVLSLAGAVLFLLLIAFANVGNLMLVRASSRGRELAVRAALGGGTVRLVRQMLAESLVLAVGGALLGLLLAWIGIRLLVAFGPQNMPRLESIHLDLAVVAFAALAGLAGAVGFGVIPALRAARPNLMDALRSSGRTSSTGTAHRLRSAVVVAEVALSFILLIGSGLMWKSLLALERVDPGFEARGVLTFLLSGVRGPAPQRAAFIRQLRDGLLSLPGVQSVAAASPLPLDGLVINARWGTEAMAADPNKIQQADVHMVLPGYFEALHTRVAAGRTFTDADNVPEPKIIVIDQLLAAKAFPGVNPVGKRLLIRVRSIEPEWVEVIGVVAHQRHASLASDGREAMFVTDGFMGHGVANRWIVRTAGDPSNLSQAVRGEVHKLDKRLAVSEMQPMTAFMEKAQASTRFSLILIAVFSIIAAFLAAVGLYGVLSAAVRQRTSEIGVRMALGATPQNVFRLTVGQGLRLSAVGIGIGVLVAVGLTRLIQSLLVGVAPTDPATFISMTILFLVIAGIASWLPARRAARLDPASALRDE
jgi:predicted permease